MGKRNTFKRGTHPNDFKELSIDAPITEYVPLGDIVIPMSQHIGKPADPIVNKGDRVLVGQKIGEANGFISASVHSSVSGTVKDIRTVSLCNGSSSQAIVITNDGLNEQVDIMKQKNDVSRMSNEEIREKIKEAGIVGLGGAGFPTHVKLTPPEGNKVEYIVINAAECEPYITSDYRLMLEHPEDIIKGIKIILKLFPEAQCVIGIEENKGKAVEVLSEFVKNESNISIEVLETKYPQGAEKQLVYATTGRTFTSQELPIDVGCIVQNVSTCAAIYSAVTLNEPLITRIVTLSGPAISKPSNFKVPVGTNLNELIEAAGGYLTGVTPEKIIAGGPMMGFALYTTDLSIIKGTNAFVFMIEDEVSNTVTSNCIRCGNCVDVCPNGLMPLVLERASIEGDEELFLKYNGLECCECGCCSYICPSKRHLAQAIRVMKREIMAKRKNSEV